MSASRRSTPSPTLGHPMALPVWGAVCFFASGAAGLMYEVAWSKQLSYLLGNSLHAVATVVAAFLGGLALGARVLGVPLARRANGGRTYAVLELGVGLLGVVSLPVLRGLDPLVGEMYRALGGEGPAFALARFTLLFALLVPPAALMGATLPVLVGYFERELVGPALARLYAINTFGAVTGSVVGGFALLPGIGLTLTAWVAAAINVAVAVLAWIASSGARAPAASAAPRSPGAPSPRAAPADSHRDEPAPRRARPALAGGARSMFALMFALSGFAALVFQIAWVRLFAMMFGSSVYSFSAVLGVYLLGLALGSALVARSMSRGVSLTGFGFLQIGLAAAAALILHTFSRLPQWVFDLSGIAGTRWAVLFAGEVGITAALLLVPCALLGAAFPVAARLLQARDGGHAAGFAYAVNTLGTIAGSLAAGFWLVPTLGVQGTHVAALLLSLGVGLGSLALARRLAPAAVDAPEGKGGRARSAGAQARASAGRNLMYTVGGLTAVAALAVSAPRWDPSLMSAGLYRPVQLSNFAQAASNAPGEGSLTQRASQIERVLYYREGLNGSVLVGTDVQGRHRWLRVNGKTDASTGDMATQVLVGLLPAVLADSGARALVIGLGSGATAVAVLAGGVGPTEVVEIEPAVVGASRFFFGPGEGPLDDPRTRLILGDARTHLAHGGGRYGVIVSEPTNPWIAGVNNLFTVDFYHRVRARLEPDGVFCQWLQLYELSPEVFASLAASFLEVFPQGHLFSMLESDEVMMVAVPDSRSLSLERLKTPAARRVLTMADIFEPEGLSAYYRGPVSSLRTLARGAPLNRDDRPAVEYRAPRDMFTVGREWLHGDPRLRGLLPSAVAPPPGRLFAEWTPEVWYEAGARVLIAKRHGPRVLLLARAAEAAGLGPLARRMRAAAEADSAREIATNAMQEARAMITAGRSDEARDALERATRAEPGNGRAWVMLADVRRLAGDASGAREALGRVAQSPDSIVRAEAEIVAGYIEIGRTRPQAAAEHFRAAERWGPKHARSYLLPAQSCLEAGDPAGARETLLRGLAAIPRDPGLTAALARLGTGAR